MQVCASYFLLADLQLTASNGRPPLLPAYYLRFLVAAHALQCAAEYTSAFDGGPDVLCAALRVARGDGEMGLAEPPPWARRAARAPTRRALAGRGAHAHRLAASDFETRSFRGIAADEHRELEAQQVTYFYSLLPTGRYTPTHGSRGAAGLRRGLLQPLRSALERLSEPYEVRTSSCSSRPTSALALQIETSVLRKAHGTILLCEHAPADRCARAGLHFGAQRVRAAQPGHLPAQRGRRAEAATLLLSSSLGDKGLSQAEAARCCSCAPTSPGGARRVLLLAGAG